MPSEKSDQTNELTAPPPQSRVRVRHSFDIFADQLLTLREIVLTREAQTGQRVRLGDLVQEALDRLIANEHAGTTPRREATSQSQDQQAQQERSAGRNAEDDTAAESAAVSAVSAVSPVLVPTGAGRGDQPEQGLK